MLGRIGKGPRFAGLNAASHRGTRERIEEMRDPNRLRAGAMKGI
jgi:hypothetical protein